MPPTGEVSVIPQPWMMRRPYLSWNASISERGIAAPPDVPMRTEDRSSSRSSPTCRMPAHSVGTAETKRRLLGLDDVARARPGSCAGRASASSRRTATTANGMPHALTWNIGTTTSARSASLAPVAVFAERRQRVQVDRAVRVDDALRVAGGAARVTHRRPAPSRPAPASRTSRTRRRAARRRSAPGPRRRAPRCRPRRSPRSASTVFSCEAIAASNGSSEASTTTTLSSAWLTMCASWPGGSRRFSVCSTAPMHGTAK